MYLYKNTVTPKNTAAKITAMLCLIMGLFLWIVSSYAPLPSVFQSIAIIFFVVAIYIASVCLLRIYSYEIAYNYKENVTDAEKLYDLIIYERKNSRFIKVCHIELSDIRSVREVNPKNIKEVKAQRKSMKRYTYNTEFAASRKIEVVADLDGEYISSYSLFPLQIISVRIIAETIEEVIPHLLNPVATYTSGVNFEYFPIYGIESSVIQSCVAHLKLSCASG